MANFTEQQAIEFTQVPDMVVIYTDPDPDTQLLIEGTYNTIKYSFMWTDAFTELTWSIQDVVAFIQTQDI